MQNIFIGLILFLSVVLQTSFLPNFFPAGAVPDIALIVIIIWTAQVDFNAVLKWAILGGLLLDLASFWPIGMDVFSFVAVAFVVNSLSKRFLVNQFAWKFFIVMAMIAIGTLINYVIVFSLMKMLVSFKGLADSSGSIINQDLFLKPLYNLIVFAAIYWPLEKLDKTFKYNKRIIIKR